MGDKRDLPDRLFQFSVLTFRFSTSIPYSVENNVIKRQLIRSVTSIAANYEEAQGAITSNDFKYRVAICLKEARESFFWFRLAENVGIGNANELAHLIAEAEQIKKILGSIAAKVKT